jgi:HK97 family phage portal protein
MANRIKDMARALVRRVGLDSPAAIAQHMGFMTNTRSGAAINKDTAMALSAVYACTYRISSTIASIGIDLIKREGKNREPQPNHPAYRLVASSPSQLCTPFEFWETIVANAVLSGIGYAFIQRTASGAAESLSIIPNDQVQRKDFDGRYVYKLNSGQIVQPDDMLEIANIYRTSPILLHKENLGLAVAAQEFGAEYFGNGGRMTGILSTEQNIPKDRTEALQTSWNGAMNQGGGTKLLPFGFKYQRISISPEEAQFIETRKFQAEEICRIFSVPPALVQLDTQTTYSNVEQQNLQFARHTIAPWAMRIEQELGQKLLTTNEQQSYVFKFRLDDLARGDMQSRADYYTKLIQTGVMSINEAREREELNPTKGGNTHTVQVNQIALDQLDAYSKKMSKDEGSSTVAEAL